EARAAAALDHPHIVPIYDVGAASGQHYFTMQLVPGGSLQQLLAGGPLPPAEAARLVREVAGPGRARPADRARPPAALAPRPAPRPGGAAPTPERTVRGAPPVLTPKLTDFGLVRTRESGLSVTGQAMGTPGYMPPEQARGDRDSIGPRSDVYGLGAV